MIDLDGARALILGRYNPLLERSEPFGDVVFPSHGSSHLMHVTDLVWIKHILDDLALAEAERDSWAARICRDQDPATGLFRYPPGCGHIDEHATWQSLAALHMLGRTPQHRLACLEPLLADEGFRAWCDAYDFATSHHRFFLAVITAASTPVTHAWRQVFGEWYDAHQHPDTGLPCSTDRPHWLSPAFLLTTLRWALCGSVPRADRIVATVLAAQRPTGALSDGDLPGYMEMDAAFLLHLLGPSAAGHSGRIDAALDRLGAFLDGAIAAAERRERLLARPHAVLALCGTLAVLERHAGRDAPFPWAELEYYVAPV